MPRVTNFDELAELRKAARAFMRLLGAMGYVYSAKVPGEAAERAQLIADALAGINPEGDKPVGQAAAMEYDFAKVADMLRAMDKSREGRRKP